MDLLTLSESFITKKISPRESVEQCLRNINDNSIYNAFITICEEEALEEACCAEEEISKGNIRGPLHGVPVAIKDVIFTDGIRTTMGSKIFEDFVPKFNATVVQKLKDAGAIIIGKTHTHEFAYGPTGDRSLIGPCRNPYNPNKITGGSSGGSAVAVSKDMAYVALGSDTGGSIRIPAAACGVVGMKPTFGLVSKYGVYSTAYTLDHIGPMTKKVKDNAAMLNILAGYDTNDPYSLHKTKEDYTRFIGRSISGKKIALPSYYFQNIDLEVSKAIEKVIKVYQDLGAFIEEVEIQEIEDIAKYQVITIQAEAHAVHETNIQTRGSEYDEEVFERLQYSKNLPAYQYVIAQQKRMELTNKFNEIFNNVDILLTPTLPILPTDINQREVMIGTHSETVRSAVLRLTAPTNYTGNPGLSIPCGLSKSGLPIGFQLIGKHGSEAILYQFGAAYQQQTKS
ncbi:aspartyl-tRNA(Asn)/glutamyl-tRNA(Gln) amidotransferase subunit A [Evansella vedderi]|uniref:Aspartyl-tRNA(Asn)/glutamyl-tRNA(Gln) amidotransferase subunit A n=1 Tax=Evansella vedderi TaxID=38282 RepID=A0ABU0A0Z8_9BACI|nr:amidase [Evansella vedderi]MDQ0257158.1 aspartyl-tRNA(Asn)/glutamyl-tRNA(Gln) amidotransferase subunit A [Evansella vedderi]